MCLFFFYFSFVYLFAVIVVVFCCLFDIDIHRVSSVLLKHLTVQHLSPDKLAENFANSTLGIELKLLAMAQVRAIPCALCMDSSH